MYHPPKKTLTLLLGLLLGISLLTSCSSKKDKGSELNLDALEAKTAAFINSAAAVAEKHHAQCDVQEAALNVWEQKSKKELHEITLMIEKMRKAGITINKDTKKELLKKEGGAIYKANLRLKAATNEDCKLNTLGVRIRLGMAYLSPKEREKLEKLLEKQKLQILPKPSQKTPHLPPTNPAP